MKLTPSDEAAPTSVSPILLAAFKVCDSVGLVENKLDPSQCEGYKTSAKSQCDDSRTGSEYTFVYSNVKVAERTPEGVKTIYDVSDNMSTATHYNPEEHANDCYSTTIHTFEPANAEQVAQSEQAVAEHFVSNVKQALAKWMPEDASLLLSTALANTPGKEFVNAPEHQLSQEIIPIDEKPTTTAEEITPTAQEIAQIYEREPVNTEDSLANVVEEFARPSELEDTTPQQMFDEIQTETPEEATEALPLTVEDLTQTAEEDLTQIAEDLPLSVDDLAQIAEDLPLSVDELAQTAEEIPLTVEDLTQTAEQLLTVEGLTQTAQENLTQIAEEIPLTAEDLTQTAEEATEVVDGLTPTIEEPTLPADELTQAAEELPLTVEDLTQTAEEITQPSELESVKIEDVTPLLSEEIVEQEVVRVEEDALAQTPEQEVVKIEEDTLVQTQEAVEVEDGPTPSAEQEALKVEDIDLVNWEKPVQGSSTEQVDLSVSLKVTRDNGSQGDQKASPIQNLLASLVGRHQESSGKLEDGAEQLSVEQHGEEVQRSTERVDLTVSLKVMTDDSSTAVNVEQKRVSPLQEFFASLIGRKKQMELTTNEETAETVVAEQAIEDAESTAADTLSSADVMTPAPEETTTILEVSSLNEAPAMNDEQSLKLVESWTLMSNE